MPLGAITQFAFGGALTAANLNAPVNSLKSLVDTFYDNVPTTYFTSANMTVAGTANKGVLRDGAGSGFFTGSVTASSGFIGNISGNTNISGNGSVTGTFNVAGNTALSGTLLVSLGSTFTGAITASGGVIGNATTATNLLAPVAFNALSSEYRPTTNASADTITLGAGPFYPDSAGNIVTGTTSQNVSLSNAVSAAQPTGTNSQYVLISFAPGTTTPTVTGGTVSGGAPAAPASPSSANWPIALVLRRGVTTNPSGVIAAGDIIDLRGKGWGGGGTGGAGGADTAVRAAAVWIQGTNVTFANGHDSTNSAEAGWFHPNLVKRGAAFASGDYIQQRFIEPTLLSQQTLTKTAPNTITLAASATNPVSIRHALLTASVTATASGSAGPRYAIFDTALSSGAGALVTPMPNLSTLTATQTLLAVYWWDGTTLQDSLFSDVSPLGVLPSTSLTRTTLVLPDNGSGTGSLAINTGTNTLIPTMPPLQFFTPVQCRLSFVSSVGYTYVPAGTLPAFYLSVIMDTVVIGRVWGTNVGGIVYGPGPWTARDVVVAPGSHTIGLAYQLVAGVGSTLSFAGTFNEVVCTFWKA